VSHDEEMAVIGRLVSDNKNAQRERALLQAEAHRLGGLISSVGACLLHDDPMETAGGSLDEEHLKVLDPVKVKQMINDIHEVNKRIAGYASRLRSLNL
jgi:hypothetical protein